MPQPPDLIQKHAYNSEEARAYRKTLDIFFAISVGLLVLTQFFTSFYIHSQVERTKADYEQVSRTVEQNWITKVLYYTDNFRGILARLIVPGLIIGGYLWLRERISPYYLSMIVYIWLGIALFNFTNDLSVVLSLFA